MFCNFIVSVIIAGSVIIDMKVPLRALLKSMAKSLVEADVAMPNGTPFSEMANLKTVVTLKLSHIDGVGDNISVGWWGGS